MRTTGVVIALLVASLATGCGSGGEKSDPCKSVVASEKSLDSAARAVITAYGTYSQNGVVTGTPKALQLRNEMDTAVRTWGHLVSNSSKCFAPELVAEAQSALDQLNGAR